MYLTLSFRDLGFLGSYEAFRPSAHFESRMEGRMGGLSSWMRLSSPLFHLLVKPHREIAGTFKVEHKGLPCVSNNVYFLIIKFPTQIPVRGIVFKCC